MLTMEPWENNQILLRFEHIFEKDEDETFSVPQTFNIRELFPTLRFLSIEEMTLDGNKALTSIERLPFPYTYPDWSGSEKLSSDSFEVTLHPMEIKTFFVTIKGD